MTLPRAFALLAAGLLAGPAAAADPAKLALRKGDTVAVVGNGLADRMQHDAWLDAYLHARFPDLDLTVRHLGFAGDEVGGYTAKPDTNKRMRSANFGSADDWFRRVKADVVLAFWGANESFAGKDGLAAFKQDLDGFVKHAKSQNYSGKGPPRVVLFTPTAVEPARGRNLPDADAANARVQPYVAAVVEVAKANGVPAVDLFGPTKGLFAAVAQPLTINGVHLTAEGNHEVAKAADRALFGGDAPADTERLEKVRAAARDRNAHWFQRYRATDGYSVFGERSKLRFAPDNQTNADVASRELEVIDVLTANRDKVVWAAANGRDERPDDGNTPPFVPVKTNKPGAGPGGKHLFLSGQDAIKSMTVGKGLQVNLFADEAMFPELVNPVQMAWDTRGRLWVAVWPTYPHWTPKGPMNDKLLVLEDTDGDGKADKCDTFAGDLHNPTGFEFFNGGVLVAQVPDLLFLKDTDGDGKADTRERVLHGLDSADTHHSANSFVLDPGGAVYFQEGTFHHSQVESPYGPPERVANGAVFRYEPRTQKVGVYVSTPFANPHGHAFDRWGQDIVVDGTGAQPYHAPLFSGYLPYPQKHPKPPQVYQQRTRPCGGMEYLYSKHFPDDFWGNLVVTNVIGFQGLLRYKVTDNGASLKGAELEPIVSSTDPNFRPVDAKTGPDGALYFVDWHNPIIGHMQHNLRDPSRDREHGRVYRVSAAGRPANPPAKIAGEPVGKLLDLLTHPEDKVRYRARIELAARPTQDVLAAVGQWGPKLERELSGEALEHALLEALWLHQSHDEVNTDLLKRVLRSPDFRARAAGTRVLCYWRDRRPDTLERLRKLAADDHPRVRMEAVRAASFFTQPEAVEVVLIAADKGKDPFVEHVAGETMKALDPHVKRAIAAGREIRFTTPAGARYFVQRVAVDDLLKMPRTAGVFAELLRRPGVRDEVRREAAAGLAGLEKEPEVRVLLDALKAQDRPGADESVAFDLARQLTARPAELAAVRGELEQLAASAGSPVLRQMGYVALVAADGSPDRAWALASKSAAGLKDLATAVPQLRDPGHRAALFPRLAGLLDGLPDGLTVPKGETPRGRFVRIEFPGRLRTLVLSEVEVLSGGANVARRGKATMKAPGNGTGAAKAIDGDLGGPGGDSGEAVSQTGTEDPWWEVDLGADRPVDAVVVHTRTKDQLDRRLNNFTLTVLAADRKPVFRKAGLSAPDGKTVFPVGAEDPAGAVRAAAMLALTSVRGREADAFRAVARFVKAEADRPAAVKALQRVPVAAWPKDEAAPLLEAVAGYVRAVPEADRTAPAVVDALQLADALAGLLPRDQARAARKALGDLGVRVVRVGTLTDQMLFDKDRIVVQAGKPVEFVVENTDLMPHNFVITRMGALEEVGNEAEAFGTRPGAQERHFVPPSPKVLAASRLLQPRESQAVRWAAPAEPGVYPYVCTYPGHWRRMHGALYVVADLDEYLADPEGYVARNPVPVADALLKLNRPRTEWTLGELTQDAVLVEKGGRSFAHGKQLFAVATCVACHKLAGEGQEFGPDLARLDPKVFRTPVDVLQHILEPSLRIEDKYRSYTFNLSAGGTVTGMVLEKSPAGYKVIENPLAKAEARVVKADDLDDAPRPAPTSIMPKGLLDKLAKEEVLDLLAYVWAKADPKHPAYHGSHGHHGHGHGGHKH